MTVTDVTPVPGVPAVLERLGDTEYEAAIQRLRAYRRQMEDADHQADADSLDRARDLAAIYADKRWVKDLPPPKNKVWRGKPVEPDSRSRFAKWAKDHIDYAYGRSYQLLNAFQVHDRLCHHGDIKVPAAVGERALRPLSKLLRDNRPEQATDVWRRAVQLADGQTPTNEHVRKALADHDKAMGYTQPRTRSDDGQSFASVSKRFLRDAEWIVRNGTEAQRQKVIAELQARLAQLQQAK